MFQHLITLLLTVCCASVAHASFMLEPYIGYEKGSVKTENVVTPANSTTASLDGVAYGARVGYRFLIPWIALDYTAFSGKLKPKNPLLTNADATQSSLGLVVGADLPVLLRVWGGYGFLNQTQLKYEDAASTKDKFKGSYTKVGLGCTLLPFVSINVEYQMNNYDKLNSNDIDATYSKFDHNSLLLSVSLPLHF
jgi:hypothetical protein